MTKSTQLLRKHLYIIDSILKKDFLDANDVAVLIHSNKKALKVANELHKQIFDGSWHVCFDNNNNNNNNNNNSEVVEKKQFQHWINVP